jgi:NAD(P)-dependent dehydrogenase (short-subunit alcohol dehydrogenase family)
MRLAGKLAVVTAAASGMGKAGVELFLREGAKVLAIDVNAAALAKLAEEARGRGQSVETLQADLSRQEVMRSSVHEAAARLGGIDVMWAHAGIPGPAGIEDLDLAAYGRAMALNVDSAALAAGEVIKHMRKRGGGSLIFTASVSGLVDVQSGLFSRQIRGGRSDQIARPDLRARQGPRERDLSRADRYADGDQFHQPLRRSRGSRS